MYGSLAAMINQFGERVLIDLTDRDDTGFIDEARIAQALTDAGSAMDVYIAARYPLPLPTTPPVLNNLVLDIARYKLDIQPDEAVTKRHDDAIRVLSLIAKGEVSLGMPPESEPESIDTAEITSAGSVFSRENGKAFI
jgi:phage gp36-like protein